MAADLNLLQPEFRAKVNELLQKCQDQGIEMRPNEGLRDPFIQAKYWRQSRSGDQIATRISDLKAQGGLTAGGLWATLKDWPHVQMNKAASPLGEFTLQEIDATMKSRFGQG